MKGLDAHRKRLKKLRGARAMELVSKALFAAGEKIQVEAQLSITRGAVSGKDHVASLAGEAPNNDTGVLANNIETVQKGPLLVEVSSNAPYAAALESGSNRKAGTAVRSFSGKETLFGPNKVKQGPVKIEFGDSKTAARPYMRPARDKMLNEVTQFMVKAVKKAVKMSGV